MDCKRNFFYVNFGYYSCDEEMIKNPLPLLAPPSCQILEIVADGAIMKDLFAMLFC